MGDKITSLTFNISQKVDVITLKYMTVVAIKINCVDVKEKKKCFLM